MACMSEGEVGATHPSRVWNFRLGAGLSQPALEADRTDALTALTTTPRLSFLDARPRTLVQGVVVDRTCVSLDELGEENVP